MKRGFPILTSAEVARIHAASLQVLQETGVKFPHEGLLDLFQKNGAAVDARSGIVKIPAALVDASIKKQVENNARHLHADKPSGPDQLKGWMSLGNLKSIVDYRTDSARDGNLRNVLQSIAIANALPNIERVAAFVEPADVDPGIVDVVFFYLLSLFSAKRFFLVPVTSLANARCMIAMARVIAENEAQLRGGDLIEYELEPIANLEFSTQHLEIAWEFALQKLKVFVGHYCFMGKDSPPDYLSAIMLTNANILAAVTAAIVMNPDHYGVDYVFATHGIKSAKEPRPLFGAPHQTVFAMAARQLADFYGFRHSIGNAGLTDSCTDDFQSGFERGVSAAVSALCGNKTLGLQGIVGADQAVSLDELIIDDALLSYLNHILKGMALVANQTVDIQGIKDVGIGGTFLDRMETAAGYRELTWSSPVFSSETFESWAASNPKRGALVEKEKQDILARSFPPKVVVTKDRMNQLTRTALATVAKPESFKRFLALLEREVPGFGALA